MMGSLTKSEVSADDVCVRCRVRRSVTASKLDFGAVVEMSCIMRHWSSETTPIQRANSTGSWVNSLHSSGGGGDSTTRTIQPELIFKAIGGGSSHNHHHGSSNDSSSSFFPSASSSSSSSSPLHQNRSSENTSTNNMGGSNTPTTKRYRSPSPLNLRSTSLSQSRDSEDQTTQLRLDTRSISPGPKIKVPTRRRSESKSRSQSRTGSRRRGGMLPPVGTTAAAVAAFQVDNTTTNNTSKGLVDESSGGGGGIENNDTHKKYIIPLTDIVRASLENTPKDETNSDVKGFLLYLISNNHGMLELNFHSVNSRDIVYAFLNANIPEDKLSSIRRDDDNNNNNNNNNNISLEKKESVDMEDFQAKKVKDRFINETMKQKMTRKMSLFACRISEAVSFSDCCLCGSDLGQVGQEPSSSAGGIRKTPGVGLELYDSKKSLLSSSSSEQHSSSLLSSSSTSRTNNNNNNNKTSKNNRFQTPEKVALHQLPPSKILNQSIAANRPPKPNNNNDTTTTTTTPVVVVRSNSDTNFPDVVKIPTSKSTLDFEMATTGSLELSTGNEENNINHNNTMMVEPVSKSNNIMESPKLLTVEI